MSGRCARLLSPVPTGCRAAWGCARVPPAAVPGAAGAAALLTQTSDLGPQPPGTELKPWHKQVDLVPSRLCCPAPCCPACAAFSVPGSRWRDSHASALPGLSPRPRRAAGALLGHSSALAASLLQSFPRLPRAWAVARRGHRAELWQGLLPAHRFCCLPGCEGRCGQRQATAQHGDNALLVPCHLPPGEQTALS